MQKKVCLRESQSITPSVHPYLFKKQEAASMHQPLAKLLVLLGILTFGFSLKSDSRPNILFIFTDDHAPHAISAYDKRLASVNPTPVIDSLAAEGMVFINSFCTNSICGPSRAVIQTGKHSHINGFKINTDRFDWDQQTFPKLLQAAGYQTALYGKYHLRGTPQGYDKWVVLPGQGAYYNPSFMTPDGNIKVEGYCTDVVTDMAVDYLENLRDTEKPFMLMVQHKAPHRNWRPAIRHLDLYTDRDIPVPDTLFDDWSDNASALHNQEMEIDRHLSMVGDLFAHLQVNGGNRKAMKGMTEAQIQAFEEAYGPRNQAMRAANLKGKDLVLWKYQRYLKNYLRTLVAVDESVETLLNTLDRLSLDENTIVIYSSDQGFYLGDHGFYDKRWMYEESLKMPFIIRWPGVIKPGSRSELMIQNLDYAPTFLDIAGAPIPDDLQGRSLLPLLKGNEPAGWRTSIYYHFFENSKWHRVAQHCGVRTERFKLIHFYQTDEWEFYDLMKDPDELLNQYDNPEYNSIISEHKERLNELKTYYRDNSDFSLATTASKG
ncbi:MAG: sulfatase [Verrucomicrobiota bacterium]